MAARLAALVAAIAMVVAAIVIRARIDRASTTIRLTCATELEAACRAIGNGTKVTIEPAGVTADRLVALDSGADPGLDAWLAPGPWPQIVDSARTAGPLFKDPRSIAQTRVGLTASKGRAASLCAPATWDCVVDAMAKADQNADIADPGNEATGALVLAAIAAGRPVDDVAVQNALARLKRVRTLTANDAVSNLLTTNGADIGLVAGLEAVTQPVVSRAANSAGAAFLYPQPVSNAEVVLGVTGSGKTAARARDVLGGEPGRNALRDAGWNTDPNAGSTGDPSVIAALRAAWKAQQ